MSGKSLNMHYLIQMRKLGQTKSDTRNNMRRDGEKNRKQIKASSVSDPCEHGRGQGVKMRSCGHIELAQQQAADIH